MVKDFFIGIAATLPLAMIAVADPNHVANIGDNKIASTLIANFHTISGIDLSSQAKLLTIAFILIAMTFAFTTISFLIFGRSSGQKKLLNKNIKLIFDSIENGREQLSLLEGDLRSRQFGQINTRAFDKMGHARRILDALEHRARQLAAYYQGINSNNRDEVEALFETPLKFSVSCVNSVRDTQAIEVIPEILPLEAVIKLDLLFNGVRREVEESDSLVAQAEIEEDEEIRLPEVIAA